MGFFDFFRARPTPDGFADLVLRQVRQRHPGRASRYEAAAFRIVLGGGEQQIFNLDNAYRDYCAAPRKLRAQVLQNYLAGIDVPALPATFAEAREQLMPVIRSRSQGDYLRLLALRQPPRPALADAWLALDDDALILLAHDTAASMATIGQATLAQWGVTFEQALAVAMENLRARTPHRFLALGDGLLMGEWDDAYDSSRLLLPDLLYRACAGGEPLVMIPTRGRFLLASSHNVAGQLRMVALADKLMQDEGRHVSPAMYGVPAGDDTCPSLRRAEAGVGCAQREHGRGCVRCHVHAVPVEGQRGRRVAGDVDPWYRDLAAAHRYRRHGGAGRRWRRRRHQDAGVGRCAGHRRRADAGNRMLSRALSRARFSIAPVACRRARVGQLTRLAPNRTPPSAGAGCPRHSLARNQHPGRG